SSLIEFTVSVTSPNGDQESISRGVALPQILSVAFSRVRVNPTQLLADGSTQATVQIVLLDTLRVPIAGVDPELVEVSVEGGDVEITPPQAPSDDRGNMVATFVARSPGEGIVKVRVEGRELVEQPRVVFIPGPPASISVLVERRRLIVGGEDSTAVVVTIFDNFGNRVRDGVSVIFSAPDGIFNPSFTTTRDGVARTTFYSGTTAGTASFTVTASEGGVSVEEEVEDIIFLPGPPEQIRVTAETYLVEVASQNEVLISVTDRFNNPLGAGVLIALSVSPAGQGSVVPDTLLTDSTGTARSTFIAGRRAGETARVVAVSGNAQGRSAPFTFLPAPPGQVAITANPAQQVVGRDVNLSVQVTDVYGNPVSDTTIVVFSSDPVRGSFNPRSVRTSGGEARSAFQEVTTAGPVVVIATAGEVEGSTVVTFTPDAVSQLALEASPSDLRFGQTASLTATATDRYDNPVPGAELQFAIIQDPGGSRLMFNQRVTNQRGQAVNAFTAGNSAGTAIIAVIYNPDGGDPEAEGLVFINITAQ
ncbi:MAG: Ig-like domain-containing protein, partial [bacterium]